ncbi:hypothetical protein EBX31_04570 [bacterium]|nr:hypothetical protein [bacterium]
MISIWVGFCAFFVWLQARRAYGGAGFVFIYILLFSVIHLFGAIIHAIPEFSLKGVEYVVIGFRESLYGLVAFCAGAFLPILGRATLEQQTAKESRVAVPHKTIWYLMGLGIAFFFARAVLGKIPSIGAAINAGTTLMVVAMVLGFWTSWIEGRKLEMFFWMALCAGFPLFSLTFQGFLGFGISVAAIVLLAIASFYRPQWRVWTMGIPAIYFALSLYVTYMRERTEIREEVWGGSKMEKRIEKIQKIYDNFEWLDLEKEEHIQRIDERMNQNSLVGMTVDRIERGDIYPVNGITLWWGIQSLIPRIIWWNKPVTAGSMNVAGYFTGQEYAKGTSVGLGQVMELYGNYKRWGVLIGFFLLGWLISIWDIRCGQALRLGDWKNYSCYFILLVPLLQPGGSAVELCSGTAAAAVLVWFLRQFVFRDEKKQRTRETGLQEAEAVPAVERPRRFVYGEQKK